MPITIRSTVGRVAAEHPLATRVFSRHNIDFCCGGGRPLEEVCGEKGLEVDAVLREIEKELANDPTPVESWSEAPLGNLIDHILTSYHAPLHEEMPRLDAMARKVLEVHREKDPERLSELVSVYSRLRVELEAHMSKEEQVLFPMIRRGQGAMAEGPIAVMLNEHDAAAELLRRIRELTDGYVVPEKACNTWRALWFGLVALEESLHQHIHLENNILFPRAIDG